MKDNTTTRVENRKLCIFRVLSPIMAPPQISFTSRQTQTAYWMQDCALELNTFPKAAQKNVLNRQDVRYP